MADIEDTYPGARMAPSYFRDLALPEERQFQQWYQTYSKQAGLDPNPDDSRHQYNYRAWWVAQQLDSKVFAPKIDPSDNRLHAPSLFKAAAHPTRYIDRNGKMFDSILGK